VMRRIGGKASPAAAGERLAHKLSEGPS